MPSTNDSAVQGRTILIVDDHEAHRTLLMNYLGALGCECTGAEGGNTALEQLDQRTFDLCLLDLRMDDIDGMEVLKRARSRGHLVNTIMMSAEGTISHAVDAIRLGAKDFLVKPFELEQLHETVCRVIGGSSNPDQPSVDPRLLWRDKHAPDMIGEHPALLEIFLVLERIAHTDCTVLVLGESGTGKELVARAIHNASLRRDKPFVPVNCGAIPETLIESELFGHARGAFSGATQAREGRFAVADTGTLFLDEIGEMSLSVQVNFLRVLQEGEFVPVGETKPRKCDVRIIAATNKNLEAMAEEGTFREDLFYRLNLIPIHLPPLRDRMTDVPLLASHFLKRQAKRQNQPLLGFSDEALELMMQYPWNGNVRELENAVERMTLLHQGSGMLDVNDLPPRILHDKRRTSVPASATHRPRAATTNNGAVLPMRGHDRPATGSSSPASDTPPSPPPTPTSADPGPTDPAPSGKLSIRPDQLVLPDEGIVLREWVQAFEMNLIDQALERTNGNRNKAARLLGMNRTTLVERLRRGQR